MGTTKRTIARLVGVGGYEVHSTKRAPRTQFVADARPYFERRDTLTVETVFELRERYRDPVFGVVPVWDLVEMLSHIIDPMDPQLMTASQEVHTLQVLEAMAADGVDDESILLAGILHDVGKVVSLVDEDPAYIFGGVSPLGENAPGIGLDNCVFQWGADEFAYERFVGRVPDHVGWLIRHHSIHPPACMHLMDDRDRDYYERYLKDFKRWDGAKAIGRVPRTRISDYRPIVDAALPDPIPI